MTGGQWCEDYLAGSTHKRASTLHRDRSAINLYVIPAIGSMPMSAVTPRDIKGIIDSLANRLAPSTIRGISGLIKTLFRTAVEATSSP